MIIQERIEAVGNASYLHSRVSPSTYAYGYFFIPTIGEALRSKPF